MCATLSFARSSLLVLAAAVYALQGVEAGPAVSNYSEVYDLFAASRCARSRWRTTPLTWSWEPVGGNYKVSYKLYSFELFYEDFNDIIVKTA